MNILGQIVTIIVTIAVLVQGIDSFINLLARWKSIRNEHKKRVPDPTKSKLRLPIRLTQKKLDSILFALPWYSILLFEIQPVYHLFAVFSPFHRIMESVLYLIFLAFYPVLITKTEKKRLLIFVLVFPIIVITFANLSFFVTGFTEQSWYSDVFAIVHGVCFTAFKASFIIFFVQDTLIPWRESFPVK